MFSFGRIVVSQVKPLHWVEHYFLVSHKDFGADLPNQYNHRQPGWLCRNLPLEILYSALAYGVLCKVNAEPLTNPSSMEQERHMPCMLHGRMGSS